MTLRLGVKEGPDVAPRGGSKVSSFLPQLGSPTTRLSLQPVHSSAIKFIDRPTLFTRGIHIGSFLYMVLSIECECRFCKYKTIVCISLLFSFVRSKIVG